MSVYHCPLCPLIFQYRTEVEWHLREEHRSRTDEEADLRAELAAAAGGLDWDRLQALRSSTAGPSVTLLLATTPASSMTVLDIARLRQLADRARRRLPAEPDRGTTAPTVAHRVAKAVAAAEGSATDHGLAVMVNPNQLAIVTLPLRTSRPGRRRPGVHHPGPRIRAPPLSHLPGPVARPPPSAPRRPGPGPV